MARTAPDAIEHHQRTLAGGKLGAFCGQTLAQRLLGIGLELRVDGGFDHQGLFIVLDEFGKLLGNPVDDVMLGWHIGAGLELGRLGNRIGSLLPGDEPAIGHAADHQPGAFGRGFRVGGGIVLNSAP